MKESTNNKKQEFLKAKEVSERFFDGKISYAKVLQLAKDGKLPGKKIGKIYFFTMDALNEWAQKNMSTPVWRKLL